MDYSTRYVHKIAPRASDVGPGVTLPDSALTSRRALGQALRERGIMRTGQAVQAFRFEGSKLVVFPQASVWHSIVLEPVTKSG